VFTEAYYPLKDVATYLSRSRTVKLAAMVYSILIKISVLSEVDMK